MKVFNSNTLPFLGFCIGLLISACTPSQNSSEKKILFLGDSFTVGTGLGEGQKESAFPYQLINKLRANGLSVAEPKIYAIDGDTTKHLLGALNAIEPQSNPDHPTHASGNYDLVVLSIGVNDLFRGHNAADYQHHFGELLDRAIRFANDDLSRVMVLSIPAWDASPSVHNESGTRFRSNKYTEVRNKMNQICVPVNAIEIDENDQIKLTMDVKALKDKIEYAKQYNTPSGIAQTVDRFNSIAKEIIEKKNHKYTGHGTIRFVDLTALTRISTIDEETGKHHFSLFANDGIHYSALMYEKWTHQIYPMAYEILQNKS